MSVDIGRVIVEGAKRTVARNGLFFVAIVWVLGLASSLFWNSVFPEIAAVLREMVANLLGPGQGGPPIGTPTVGPSLGLPPVVAGLLWIVVSLLSLVVTAAAIRTFVTAETEAIPDGVFTRNLLWMLLNLIVGGFVFAVVLFLGFIALILPFFFLLVSLYFWNVYVIVEDENFVEGFSNSWAVTRGNRIVLFLLGVFVVIVTFVIGAVFGVVGGVLPGIAAEAITQIGSAFVSVFTAAATARAFVQLRGEGTTAPA